MKTKILLLIFAISLAVLSCNKEDYDINETVFDPDVSSVKTLKNAPVVFTDYSTRVVKRTWKFTDDASITTSSDASVSVIFSKEGIKECTIENEFDNGMVMTKTINVRVDAFLLNYKISNETPKKGQVVVFTDNSEEIASRVWTFPSGNPSTSTGKTVEVTFPYEDIITCNLEATNNFGETVSEDFVITVGTNQYARSVFSFEDPVKAAKVWNYWNPIGEIDDVTRAELTFVSDPNQGALNSNGYAKFNLKQENLEFQLFTKNVTGSPNAKLKPNTKYELSFYVKSNDFTQLSNGMGVFNQVSGSQAFHQYTWYGLIPVTSDWEFRTIPFNSGNVYGGANANNAYIQFNFRLPKGTVYIDEIWLREIP